MGEAVQDDFVPELTGGNIPVVALDACLGQKRPHFLFYLLRTETEVADAPGAAFRA